MSTATKYPSQDALKYDIVDNVYGIFKNRVIVAGSRTYNNYPEFSVVLKEYLSKFEDDVLIYSGMAPEGADKLAVDFCESSSERYKYLPFKANWAGFGKGAGMVRNREMARTATHLIAFYDGISRGTADMIAVAKKLNLDVTVIDVIPDEKAIVRLYTVQMAKWRMVEKMGVKLIDITFKSGVPAFAPEMSAALGYKRGEMSEEDYTSLYNLRMGNSKVNHQKYWDRLVEIAIVKKQLAFACYCPADAFCHRHLFVQMVQDYLEVNDVDSIIVGELK